MNDSHFISDANNKGEINIFYQIHKKVFSEILIYRPFWLMASFLDTLALHLLEYPNVNIQGHITYSLKPLRYSPQFIVNIFLPPHRLYMLTKFFIRMPKVRLILLEEQKF